MTSGREASTRADPDAAVGSSRRARYQAIVDLRTGRPIGWEAAGSGDDDPEGALAALAALAEGASPPEDGLVFVHVSADLIADPRLIEQVERVGAQVVVDVRGTEVDRLGELSSELDALATAGVHLSIENTSGVSLAMIARVRPSFVKLDAQLVRDIVHEPANRSVVRAYVAFAEHEDIYVIAEGVERHDQLDELRALGIVLARGPLFGQPAALWATPTPRRRRPPLVLDPIREVRERLAAAGDAVAVAGQLAGELHRIGSRAAVYFERDGQLRCVAHEGHADVLDGIPVRSGLLGRAFRGNSIERSEDEHGGGPCLAMALSIRDRAVGVATLASHVGFTPDQEEQVRELVQVAGERLAEVGPLRAESSTYRLARATHELSLIGEVNEVEVAAARLACVVGGMSSAIFALPGATGLDIKAVQGPLASALRSLAPGELGMLLEHVGEASSCIARAGHDEAGSALVKLLEAGAASLIALPVRSSERGTGMLLLADHAPVQLDLDSREALELLANEVSRSLDMVVLVDDLRTRATVDTLTGLGNLSSFQEALTTAGSRRRGGWALVMADVDGLKAVNDTHGHLTGDLALRRLASAIQDVLRTEDRMFRIGGDEFAALLQDVDADLAAEVGRRMCEAASSVMSDFGAGLSVGIAIPEPGEAPADFIDRADKMLYQVKRQDPGTVRVAPPTRR